MILILWFHETKSIFIHMTYEYNVCRTQFHFRVEKYKLVFEWIYNKIWWEFSTRTNSRTDTFQIFACDNFVFSITCIISRVHCYKCSPNAHSATRPGAIILRKFRFIPDSIRELIPRRIRSPVKLTYNTNRTGTTSSRIFK